MKEAFEKIINKLIDKQNHYYERMVFARSEPNINACSNIGKGLKYAIEIVNEVAEEFAGDINVGSKWIPCSERLPEIRDGMYGSGCVLVTERYPDCDMLGIGM